MDVNEQNIKLNIMRRVRFIHRTRRIFNPTAMKAGAFAVFALWGASIVSLKNILHNMPAEPNAVVKFFIDSFSNTESVVKVLLLAVAVAGVLFIADLVKKMSVRTTTA